MNVEFKKLENEKKPHMRTKEVQPDLTYSTILDRFFVGNQFFDNNNMAVNGFIQGILGTDAVALGVQPEENSDFFKKRKNRTTKGKKFRNDTLKDALVKQGLINLNNESTEFTLYFVGEKDGSKVFEFDDRFVTSDLAQETISDPISRPTTIQDGSLKQDADTVTGEIIDQEYQDINDDTF